jgi:hypothetical protein
VLDALEATSYKACFFVTADEIEDNADLLRRAACKGHNDRYFSDGLNGGGRVIRNTGRPSALLFEAAKVKTVIVAALGEAATAAEDMAKEKSLVFLEAHKVL